MVAWNLRLFPLHAQNIAPTYQLEEELINMMDPWICNSYGTHNPRVSKRLHGLVFIVLLNTMKCHLGYLLLTYIGYVTSIIYTMPVKGFLQLGPLQQDLHIGQHVIQIPSFAKPCIYCHCSKNSNGHSGVNFSSKWN